MYYTYIYSFSYIVLYIIIYCSDLFVCTFESNTKFSLKIHSKMIKHQKPWSNVR